MTGVKILATGNYLPSKIVTNEDFARILDTSDEWITTRTGMKQRHISQGEPTWFMASQAGKMAIQNAGIDPLTIDLVIIATATSDYMTPSMACMVQREIGAKNATAFDVNAACAGFIFALETARNFFLSGNFKRALIIGAENLTKMVDYDDRSTCILFGDGAGAAVIEKSDNNLYSSFLCSEGDGAKHMVARAIEPNNAFIDKRLEIEDGLPKSNKNYLFMDGKEVYKFAIRALPKAVNEALTRQNLTTDDVNIFIPHQANIRIIETASSRLGVPMDKFFVNIDKYGNTSSASVPLALHDAVTEGEIKRGDKICLVGFGSGLTYGAVVIEF